MKDFPWFKSYPEGVSHEIDPDQYSSIPHLLEESFEKYSDTVAFENMGKALTYKDIDELSAIFAAYLQQDLGLEKGDRIAIQMPNLLQYPVVMFGALRAGLIVVNTNPLYTAREMQHQFKDSGAKAIVILANFAFNLEKIIHQTDIKTVIVTEIGDMLGGVKGSIVNFVVKRIKKMVPQYKLKGHYKFKNAMKRGANLTLDPPEVKNTDYAFLQYTGGTTGVAKGASLTHRNIIANLLQAKEWFVGTEYGKETVITALPLYHIFALTVNCLFMLNLGAKSILITNPRDMKGFVKELKKHRFSIITGVNTLYNGLLNNPDFKDVDFSGLKIAVAGGMALQTAVAEHWKQVTGTEILEGYGLSETSPILSCNPVLGEVRIGTIGIPVPSTEIAILDNNGQFLGPEEPGEICARGPQVMNGYWERPEETAKTFHDDWFKTGDVGMYSEDGWFRIVDRKKDMILVSGFNVFPNEVEDVIAEHPKVLEVAAVGVPDEKSTEAVKIFVVKKDDTLTEHELHQYCKDNMAGYKKPKHIEFREELPKSNVGKILRRLLKEEE